MNPSRTTVITKRIHSSDCYSSKDACVIVVTNFSTLDFKPALDTKIESKLFPCLNGETIVEIEGDDEFSGIYLKADETFQKRAYKERKFLDADYSQTPEFKELVNSYVQKGFEHRGKGREVPEEQRAYWKRSTLRYCQEKKEKGVVLWMEYEEITTKDYQGGFSDEVFYSKELYDYVSSGGVFGWIGNSCQRTADHDRQIEAGLRERGIPVSAMFNWISSTSGRHFAESLGECTPEEQAEKIDNCLNSMYNKCLIFGTPTHRGTADSSMVIEEIYEKLGVLLPTNEEYNHEKHMEQLMKVQYNLQEKETLTPEEKFIDSIIGNIFANKV